MTATHNAESISGSRSDASGSLAGSSCDVDQPRPLVYIAGPYSHPDPVLNTRAACRAADLLSDMGAAVLVPHLSLFWHAISPAPLETWYERDLLTLRHCHALVRLPGASTGADAEVAAAERWGIPVFPWHQDDLSELMAWVSEWVPA